MKQRFEYKMTEVNDHYGLPGSNYSQEPIKGGFRAVKIIRKRGLPYKAPDGTEYPDNGFIIIYERPIEPGVDQS